MNQRTVTYLPQRNIFGFLGAEESNLLTTLRTCHRDFSIMLPMIDGAFQAPIGHIAIPVNDDHKRTVLCLYLYVHGQMYFSVACLLRCHLSNSLASTRKAIDATLTAYRLIEEPATLPQYEAGDFSYQFVKRYVEKARKKDASLYPLAVDLLKFHDLCSQFGSHADIATFIHKIAILQTDNPDQEMMTVGMFQPPDSKEEMRRYMVETFLAFVAMMKVFSSFVVSIATKFDSGPWVKQIDQMAAACYKEARELDAAIDGARAKKP